MMMKIKNLRRCIGLLKAYGFLSVIASVVVIFVCEPSYAPLSLFLILMVTSLVAMLIREHLINKILESDLGKDQSWQRILRNYESRGIRRI